MTLTPSDILEIQSAIDGYEKRFPRKPSPSVAEALAWRQGKRVASQNNTDPGSSGIDTESSQQESNRLVRTRATIRLRVRHIRKHRAGLPLWVKGVLLLCWWGLVAVLTATCFFFGAFVGGFKWVP
jgi:hypothetical protein